MTPAWLRSACDLLEHEPAIARVTVAQTRGSSPRETGTTMLVSARRQWGTIGGGQLEWQAVEQARRMIDDRAAPAARVEHLRLGPDLAQCCGGEVKLWLERLVADERPALLALCESLRDDALHTRLGDGGVQRDALRPDIVSLMSAGDAAANRQAHATPRLWLDSAAVELTELHACTASPLWIFGAGHVGQAVLQLLRSLPLFEGTCIDSRPGVYPDALRETGVAVTHAAEPVELIAMAPPGTFFLVLTHDHELDYQLCAAILARGDVGWLGLIGSSSKAARFRSRLRRAQFDAASIARLVSPVGLTSIRSKLPAAIAIGIAAQLLEVGTRAEEPRLRGIAPAASVGSVALVVPVAQVAAVSTTCDPTCNRCGERRLA